MILLGIIVLLLGGYLVYALAHPDRFSRGRYSLGGITYVTAGTDNSHLFDNCHSSRAVYVSYRRWKAYLCRPGI